MARKRAAAKSAKKAKGTKKAKGAAPGGARKAALATLDNREAVEESMIGRGTDAGHPAAVDLAADPTVLARPETADDHPEGATREGQGAREGFNAVARDNLGDDEVEEK